MFCYTMALLLQNGTSMVVSFEEDIFFGRLWRLRCLLSTINGIRVSVIPSNVETTYEERRQRCRDLENGGFTTEDLNDTLDGRTEVVLAYEVVIELVERRQVRWADIVRVARDPEMMSLIYDLLERDRHSEGGTRSRDAVVDI